MRTMAWLVVFGFGCGSGSDGGRGDGDADADTDADGDGDVALLCDEPTCRGDLTGAWDLRGACTDELQMEDEQTACPGWVCRLVEADASGHFVFGADGHADVAVSTSTRSECTVPLACLDADDTCDTFAAERPGRTCTAEGDVCNCTETAEEDGGIAGDWQILDGRTLEIRNETGMVGGNDWCAGPDTLMISWLVSASSASPNLRLYLVGDRR